MKQMVFLMSWLIVLCTGAQAQVSIYPVRSAGFKAGACMEARGDSGKIVRFVISEKGQTPFVQSCISQDTQHRSI